MRALGLGVGVGIVLSAAALVFACSSSDDGGTSPTTPEAGGSDAPITHAADTGADSTAMAGGDLQHSGTRIKLRGTQTSEGSFVFRTYFDTKLGEECGPTVFPDALSYCAPSTAASVSLYGDDQCTTMIATSGVDSCAPTFALSIKEATDPCLPTRTLYHVGAKVTPAMVYQKNGASCTGYAPDAQSNYYAVLAAVPTSELVKLTAAEVPVGSALHAAVYDGDDGSRFTRVPFVDVTRKQPCDVSLAGDGMLRCTPRGSAQAQIFSDVGCLSRASVPAYCTVPGDLFDDSVTISRAERQGCNASTVRAFPVGAKRATRDEYQSDGDGGCNGPQPAPRDVFDIGPEIAASSFPAVSTATAGGPRIVEKTYVSNGVTIAHTGQLTDTTLAHACTFASAADGKQRCLPSALGAFYFSDAGCTIALGVTSDACDLSTAKYIEKTDTVACVRSTHIFAVGTKLDPATTTAYIGTPGSCNLIGGSSALAYYTLGAEVPASTFAEGTTVTK